LVSFGVAPAFLVHKVVLRDVFPEHPEYGWFISFDISSMRRVSIGAV